MASTTLFAGQVLKPGEFLESENGLFRAVMRQTDGKFVVYHYRRLPKLERTTAWGMGTPAGSKSTLHLDEALKQIQTIDAQGTVHERRGCLNPLGFETPKCKFAENPFLVMQDDGNLVLYAKTSGGVKALFATDTQVEAPKQHRLAPPGTLAIFVEDAIVPDGPAGFVFTNDSGQGALFYSKEKVTLLESGESVTLAQPGSLTVSDGLQLTSGGSSPLLKRFLFGEDSDAVPAVATSMVDDLEIAVDDKNPKFFRLSKSGGKFQLSRTVVAP